MKKTLLRSQELSCPSCVAKIETALKAVKGVAEAKVYFNTGKIEVEHDPQVVKAEDLVKAIKSVGYEAQEAAF
jgi:copper chaperone CopZ